MAFISAYNHNPSLDHIKLAIYSLWYANLTQYIVINLFSAESTDTHDQIHHQFPYYKETYIDA